MSSVTPAEHTAIGGLAGLVEVGVMQPTVAVKNALQEGRPLPRQISAYYRGLFVRDIDINMISPSLLVLDCCQ